MAERLPPSTLIKQIASQAAIRAALDWVHRAQDLLADETVRVTEIPAPTFAEGKRAAYVAERFARLGLEQVELAADGNVYGLLQGEQTADTAPAALYAHLDTVFGPDVPVNVTRNNGRLHAPGVGDNSAGVAGVLAALEAMQHADARPAGPVWIVATVGEEGLGDLCGARAATERLAGQLAAVVAIEGSFFGRVSHTAVGSRRWRITTSAGGGHSWHDFGKSSAVHALVRAAAAISALDVPREPRTTFNIGEISGGTGVNVIAESARMLLDMRSIDAAELDQLAARVQRILDGVKSADVTVSLEEVGNRPAGNVAVTHPLVQTCAAILDRLGVTPVYAAASTDANVPLSHGIPAVTLGVTRGGGAHTRGEWVEIAPMVRGVQQIVLLLGALGRMDAVAAAAFT